MPSQYVAKPKTKMVACMDCGTLIEVGWKTKSPKRCLECKIAACRQSAIQLNAKNGPVYEKWLEGMRHWGEIQGWGVGGGQQNVLPPESN